MDRNLWILAAGLLFGAALGLSQWIKPHQAPLVTQPQPVGLKDEPAAGSLAADFTLQSLTGETVHLRDLLGTPVILNFWATWCAPCELEMPLFQEYYAKTAPELEILAVNYSEPVRDVQEFVNRLALTFPVLMDPSGEVSDLYRVNALPVTYFIDRDGAVQGMYMGTLSRTKFEELLIKIGVGE